MRTVNLYFLFFRYIFTQLSPLAKLIFNPKDDGLLNFLRDDNMKIEPQWWATHFQLVSIFNCCFQVYSNLADGPGERCRWNWNRMGN